MPSEHEINRVIMRLKLIRYLVTKAGQRGKTHGEKHHLNTVILSEIGDTLEELGCRDNLWDMHSDPLDIQLPVKSRVGDNDIPF